VKLKHIIRTIFALFLALLWLIPGCRAQDGENYIFKYDIPGNPRTLDPQTATDESALLIIGNVFEGLLKLDESGDIVAGVAGEYTVSSDGLLYTFFLREDVYWAHKNDDGEAVQCSAYDFAFAFERLFNPATKSENASRFFDITNGQAINAGGVVRGGCGVKAVDDFTLTITLRQRNPNFAYLLTTPAAFPCNEAFYISTAGRYGLSAETTPSNGSFYVTEWHFDRYSTIDNHLILRRNAKNAENRPILPYGLNFFIGEEDSVLNLRENTNHALLAGGEQAKELIDEGYPYDAYADSVWGIMFNAGVFSDNRLRLSLSEGLDRADLPQDLFGCEITAAIIPNAVRVRGEPYRSYSGVTLPKALTSDGAKEDFDAGSAAVGFSRVKSLELLVQEDSAMEELAGYITQQWQAKLGFFCRITALTADEMNARLANRDYAFALVKVKGSGSEPGAFLNYFAKIPDGGFQSLLKQAENARDADRAAALFSQAEQILTNNAWFIPVAFQTEYFIYNPECEGIVYNPFNDTVTFEGATYGKTADE
jgi:oligopeptide transport system substrate-binding protein